MPTAGAGWRIETGWRVKVTESMADRAAPAVGTSALFALVGCWCVLMFVCLVAAKGSEAKVHRKGKSGLPAAVAAR